MEAASISTALYPFASLACPVGMGAMMWVMMKGARRERNEDREPPEQPAQPASVEVLREEHRRLAEQIDRLESQPSAEPSERR